MSAPQQPSPPRPESMIVAWIRDIRRRQQTVAAVAVTPAMLEDLRAEEQYIQPDAAQPQPPGYAGKILGMPVYVDPTATIRYGLTFSELEEFVEANWARIAAARAANRPKKKKPTWEGI